MQMMTLKSPPSGCYIVAPLASSIPWIQSVALGRAAPWEEQSRRWIISYRRQGKARPRPLFQCIHAFRRRGKHTTSAAANSACMCGMPSWTGRPSCMHRIHRTILVRPVSSLDASVSVRSSASATARQLGFYKWLPQQCMQKWSIGFRLSEPC